MAHSLECLAKLIRVLLGPSSVADDKLAFGKKVDVLGVSSLDRRGHMHAVRLFVAKWTSRCPSEDIRAGRRSASAASGSRS